MSGMRRNAFVVVLFALALGLKVLLPAAGVFAHVSNDANLPQAALRDCVRAAEDGALGETQPPGRAQRHAANCPLCQIFSEGSFLLLERTPQPAALVFFEPAAPPTLDDHAANPVRAAAAHQPRGPPDFS
nr:DUF2946 family protein [Methylocystis bryophila]